MRSVTRWKSTGLSLLVVAALGVFVPGVMTAGVSAHDDDRDNGLIFNHPVIGSWFGKAQQVCPSGANPLVDCVGLGPAIPLMMTPTLTVGGGFIGNDSFALGDGPPFAPHTTAHGSWNPLSRTRFRADYVFMLPTYLPFPPFSSVPGTITALRFRWEGQVKDKTAVGTVNIYFVPAIPVAWVAPTGEFPAFPPEGTGAVTAPPKMILHPDDCTPAAPCPLVFKFTLKRVSS